MNRSALLVAALIAVACDNAPSAPEKTALAPSLNRGAAAGPDRKEGQPVHDNRRYPFARTVTNPCPPVPEGVAVEGQTHFSAHFKFFDGGNTSRLQTVTQAQGVGLVTGNKYVFHEIFRHRTTYDYATTTYKADEMIRWHVISQGSNDNFFATTHYKLTCDANGCRVEPITFETDCKG